MLRRRNSWVNKPYHPQSRKHQPPLIKRMTASPTARMSRKRAKRRESKRDPPHFLRPIWGHPERRFLMQSYHQWVWYGYSQGGVGALWCCCHSIGLASFSPIFTHGKSQYIFYIFAMVTNWPCLKQLLLFLTSMFPFISKAEDLTAQLLHLVRLEDVAKLLSKFSARQAARVMYVLIQADAYAGPKAAAMLLDCMAPTFSVR